MVKLDHWLEGIGLGHYSQTFARENIDFAALKRLTDRDLQGFGIALGDRRTIARAIERQPPEDLLEGCIGDAERRQLTVMFCDLVGSTSMSARLDPEDLRELIATYRKCCTRAIRHFGGFVQRFVGDGILAFFGYPAALEDEAERAVRAGLGIIDNMASMAIRTRQKYGFEAEVRVGIATGPVVVGDIFGEAFLERAAVVGQTPNLASRLQDLAEPSSVVIAEETRLLAAERFEYRHLGERSIKGIERPVTVFQVLRERGGSRFEVRGSRTTPLIGRKQEMHTLLDLWHHAEAGEGQVAFVCGKAGIGKSRLITAVRDYVTTEHNVKRSTPTTTIAFQCSPLHSNAALYPVARQLERMAGIEPADDEERKRAKLDGLLLQCRIDAEARSFLADLIAIKAAGLALGATVGAGEKRQGTLQALEEWFRSIAEQQPLLIIFEDLQWLDPTSKALLGRLVSWVRGARGLVLATLRIETAEQSNGLGGTNPSAEWLHQSHVTKCELTELGESDTRQLIAGASGGRPLPAKVVETIMRKAEGNPLYIEEVTKSMLGLIQRADDGNPAIDPSRLVAIPTSLSGYLLARLDQLGPAREMAQRAAVIGPEFSRDLLAKISDLPDEVVAQRLEVLVKAELITRTDAATSYGFKHALIQDAAYQSLLRRTRTEMHLRIARELESQKDQAAITDDLIAEHYALASAPEHAIAAWKRAAETAFERAAQVEAANLLEKALDALRQLPATDQRRLLELELTMQVAAALGSTHGYAAPEVASAHSRARDLSEGLGDTVLRFNVNFGSMISSFVRGDLERANEFAIRLLPNPADKSKPAHADAYLANGMVQMQMGHLQEARSLLQTAAALTRPDRVEPRFFTHGQNPGVFCRSYLAHVLAFMGVAGEAKETVEQNLLLAETRARDPSHLYSYVTALTFAARVYQLFRDQDAVNDLSERLINISRRNSYAYFEAIGTLQRGWAVAADGSLTAGLKQMQNGLAMLEHTGTGLGARGAYVQLAEIHTALGDKTEALATLARTREPEGLGTRAWNAEIERVHGEILALSPEPSLSQSERCFCKALAIARAQKAHTLELRATICYARLLQRRQFPKKAHELLSGFVNAHPAMRGTKEFADAEAMAGALGVAETQSSLALDQPHVSTREPLP